jgi:5-(carboxyamino)imidazole ribonucleotide mutase
MEHLTQLQESLEAAADRDASPESTPDIGIIMGSDSDLDVMMGSEGGRPGAYDALTELGFAEQQGDDVPDERFTFETYVVSAHRTPELMYTYAETAADRGLEVIIAGAGGKSADLPNMTASIAYPLPVIGVPVQEKSLQSVIGMPQGAPIVAVDAGKSFNAALSAVQMLARKHPELRERLEEYHETLKNDVAQTSMDLNTTGTTAFKRQRDE